MTEIPTLRNADLGQLAEMLKRNYDLRDDAVIPATVIRSEGGVIKVTGLDVLDSAAAYGYTATAIFDGHVADKLDIPVKYLRRLRDERVDLYDANVNGWLHGTGTSTLESDLTAGRAALPDGRQFLLRTFREPGSDHGIARALLSQSYAPIDNWDVLMAALDGVKQSGAEAKVVGADLTESRMTVRIAAPAVRALAPRLLAGYRSPYGVSDKSWMDYAARHGITDARPGEPVVFAGFEISNSETGGGAFTITPRITVLACLNGMKMNKDAHRQIHLGAKLESGIVKYSELTQQKNVELVAAQTRDAVATFLDVDYVEMKMDELAGTAEKVVADPAKTIERVSKQLHYTEAQQAGILDHFIKGGMVTAGGVLQAVTSYAQLETNPDAAYELETSAVQAMELAAV